MGKGYVRLGLIICQRGATVAFYSTVLYLGTLMITASL